MSSESCKRIKHLVADTTAFLNAVNLNEYALNVYTVPDVVAEVKNKRQIRRLCVLPFDLQIREPRPDSLKHCIEFSKKTGDYVSLSAIDLKVIALTYEIEIETVGIGHLRNEPITPQTIASKEKPDVFIERSNLPGWYKSEYGAPETSNDIEGEIIKKCESENQIDFNNELIEETQLINGRETRNLEKENDTLIDNVNIETDLKNLNITGSSELNEPDLNDSEDSMESDDSISTDDGWITPANISALKKSMEAKVQDDELPLVACISTDFALQNVLKQMNLHLLALDGRVIKHIRTYILRCYTCFKTTSIMTKVFCPNCGHKTLKKVSVSLDENGKQIVHINTKKPLTAKYKNQSIPRFQGGKHSRNPILFEDQPIPRQMPSRVAKTKTNALEEDYIAGFSPFVMRDIDSKSAMLRSKGNIKEWARNNTFEEDRRRKHYNRLCK